ncbi:MAG: site-2 protease family protein [Candidatus Hadarchaeales archaeon]
MMDVLFILAILIMCWNAVGLIDRWFSLKKHGFTVAPGYIMWKTERGLSFIDRIACFSKRGWIAYGDLAAICGFVMMGFIFVMLILNFILMLTTPLRTPGVMLVYPGLIPWLPIVPWLVAVGFLLVVHEFSHGILLRAQDLRTKSIGGMVIFVLFGAFVEPDEKQLENSAPSKRMRVYAAGSMANILLAFISLALILVLLTPKPGVYVWASSTEYADIFPPGARIYSVNGIQINSIDNFSSAFKGLMPGDNVSLIVEERELTLTLEHVPDNENRIYLPVAIMSAPPSSNFLNPLYAAGAAMAELTGSPVFHQYIYNSAVPWLLIDILKWIFILNLGVGLFNMLPAVPLDGGYMLRALLEKRASKSAAKKAVRLISFVVLILIVLNFVPSFLR